MLSTNKPLMDQKLIALYDNAFKNAAYEAYLKAEGYDDVDANIAKMELQNKPNPSDIKDEMKRCAKLFSDEFVKQLKNAKLLETISDEIDGHVKAITDGLIITMLPQGIATVVSPVGPCTGSMIIQSGSTANIQLL